MRLFSGMVPRMRLLFGCPLPQARLVRTKALGGRSLHHRHLPWRNEPMLHLSHVWNGTAAAVVSFIGGLAFGQPCDFPSDPPEPVCPPGWEHVCCPCLPTDAICWNVNDPACRAFEIEECECLCGLPCTNPVPVQCYQAGVPAPTPCPNCIPEICGIGVESVTFCPDDANQKVIARFTASGTVCSPEQLEEIAWIICSGNDATIISLSPDEFCVSAGPGLLTVSPTVPIVSGPCGVNATYHSGTVNVPEYCQGDLDFNGSVGINDKLALLGSWGPCRSTSPCGCCPGDLDSNDVVGINDLLLLLAAWGPCT